MVVDVAEDTVKAYQTARLKEGAAPKTINKEVGFLMRLLSEAGDPLRARLRRQCRVESVMKRRALFKFCTVVCPTRKMFVEVWP